MNNFGFVFATKMLVDSRRKVRFMYREQPDNPDDSGWRFFCGDEDQSYTDVPDNIGIYDISTILEIDDSILPLLNSPSGTAFEREDENAPFVASEDFLFDEEAD
jgi:hypothetical protein